MEHETPQTNDLIIRSRNENESRRLKWRCSTIHRQLCSAKELKDINVYCVPIMLQSIGGTVTSPYHIWGNERLCLDAVSSAPVTVI